MNNRTRRRSASALVAVLGLSGLLPIGCGDPPPPPVSMEGFQEAKKERENIIQKEYGGGEVAKSGAAAPKK